MQHLQRTHCAQLENTNWNNFGLKLLGDYRKMMLESLNVMKQSGYVTTEQVTLCVSILHHN